MVTVSLIGCMLFGHATTDSSLFWITPPKPYTLQTLFFGLASAGSGIGAIICNNRSNEYYDKYKTEMTVSRSAEYWNRVEHYEDMRTVFSVCAVAFLIPAVYFEVKHLNSHRQAARPPSINFQYRNEKLYLTAIRTF